MSEPAPDEFTPEMLRDYLADALPAEEMARVEKALRSSAELRARLEDARSSRHDHTLHSLGAIWRRARLSCPGRQELGSYLLEALEPEHMNYIKFHIEEVGCVFCQANLADLEGKIERGPAANARRHRIFHSSRHLLSGDE